MILVKILVNIEQFERKYQLPFVQPRHDQSPERKSASGGWSTVHAHTSNWNDSYCCMLSKI